nr:uncharacterized protein LOC109146962 [Ipomoea batatas]
MVLLILQSSKRKLRKEDMHLRLTITCKGKISFLQKLNKNKRICQKMHVLSKYGKVEGERRMMKHYMKSADCMMLFVLIQRKKAMMYKRKIQSWKITG